MAAGARETSGSGTLTAHSFPRAPSLSYATRNRTLWASMTTLHGASLESTLIETLVKELDNKGAMDVLRHGFRFYGKTFRVAYFKPSHGLNPDALAQFKRNELTVTRQARCHPGKGHEVDLLFALNGVPVATCELKNPMTGQTWRSAVRQYQAGPRPERPPSSASGSGHSSTSPRTRKKST